MPYPKPLPKNYSKYTTKAVLVSADLALVWDSESDYEPKITPITNLITLLGGSFAPLPVNTELTSSATPTPAVGTAGADIRYHITALAVGATFGAPTGTPVDGQRLLIRIEDNGTARTLAWNAIYEVVGTILPVTTTISKKLYIGCVYNSADTKWDVVSVGEEA